MKLLMGEPSMQLYLFCYKFNFTEFEYLYWAEYREKQKLHAKLRKVLVRSLCFVLFYQEKLSSLKIPQKIFVMMCSNIPQIKPHFNSVSGCKQGGN